ncbi:MAG: hypothetical protein II752_09440 [Muribaculaceae bacterium]|nr:hypothetical protein [Muribaculaceae bacterium]
MLSAAVMATVTSVAVVTSITSSSLAKWYVCKSAKFIMTQNYATPLISKKTTPLIS